MLRMIRMSFSYLAFYEYFNSMCELMYSVLWELGTVILESYIDTYVRKDIS
jgi:hypothetical protein